GAYYVVTSLGAAGLLLLRQKPFVAPLVRWTGWTLSLVALTTWASLLFTSPWHGPVIGPGGYLGALGRGLLAQYFGTAGSLLLAGAVGLIGLLLCTDYVLFHLAAWTATAAARKTLRRGQRKRTTTDLDDADVAMQVRIGGRHAGSSVLAEGEVDEE